jgi:hypothetical protein
MAIEDDQFREQTAKLSQLDLNHQKAQQIQDDLDQQSQIELAFRKLVHSIGDPPGESQGHLEAAYRTVEHVEALSNRVENLEQAVVSMQRDVESALTLAQQGVEKEEEMSKTQRAFVKTRDELVYRLSRDKTGDGSSVTVNEIRDKLRPEHDLQYELVKRAFQKLESTHQGFTTRENRQGDRAMYLERGAVSREVVVQCEHSLGRDDLTHTVVSEINEGGG